jgi:hypothetical protein
LSVHFVSDERHHLVSLLVPRRVLQFLPDRDSVVVDSLNPVVELGRIKRSLGLN